MAQLQVRSLPREKPDKWSGFLAQPQARYLGRSSAIAFTMYVYRQSFGARDNESTKPCASLILLYAQLTFEPCPFSEK